MLVSFSLVTQRVRKEERVLHDENLVHIFFTIIYLIAAHLQGRNIYLKCRSKKNVFFPYLRNEHHSCILNGS